MRQASVVAAGALVAGLLVATGPASTAAPAGRGASLRASEPPAAPASARIGSRVVLGGLDHPWDLAFISKKRFLFTERDRLRISLGTVGGGRRTVGRAAGLWSGGETGLMAIELAPRFARNGQFYTCHGWRSAGRTDVRVARWRLNDARTKARLVRTIVRGLPSTSGRHGGCALVFGRNGALYIGTGDAASSRTPRRLKSGGGKVLRVNPRTGRGWPKNRWAGSKNAMKRRVFTYGHRNVQGLARRGTQIWNVEQGTSRDDEVNRLRRGGDYGWKPGPGYDESVPMTDHGLPGKQRKARWRSGYPTIAASAGAWLRGKRWGRKSGRVLAITALKAQQVRFLAFNKRGRLVKQSRPARLYRRYGRLRGITVAPDGVLYVSTSNGGGRDRIIRVVPR
ncbi:glucose/arabinose dehydrogenase [Mumia flava]|uniref:Glucose/arabinose dehydrogenase n=1 Tax=Mumia flava TaxID=1348852 RepID=A0A0B2BJQ4_9ACTN|nr:PQQ-dependent sugar dehydrogenase [Mumia flava]PJJ56502.1 glucose/arabinose dehydrogenase [Mumia flava]